MNERSSLLQIAPLFVNGQFQGSSQYSYRKHNHSQIGYYEPIFPHHSGTADSQGRFMKSRPQTSMGEQHNLGAGDGSLQQHMQTLQQTQKLANIITPLGMMTHNNIAGSIRSQHMGNTKAVKSKSSHHARNIANGSNNYGTNATTTKMRGFQQYSDQSRLTSHSNDISRDNSASHNLQGEDEHIHSIRKGSKGLNQKGKRFKPILNHQRKNQAQNQQQVGSRFEKESASLGPYDGLAGFGKDVAALLKHIPQESTVYSGESPLNSQQSPIKWSRSLKIEKNSGGLSLMKLKEYGLSKSEETLCIRFVELLQQFEPNTMERLVVDIVSDAQEIFAKPTHQRYQTAPDQVLRPPTLSPQNNRSGVLTHAPINAPSNQQSRGNSYLHRLMPPPSQNQLHPIPQQILSSNQFNSKRRKKCYKHEIFSSRILAMCQVDFEYNTQFIKQKLFEKKTSINNIISQNQTTVHSQANYTINCFNTKIKTQIFGQQQQLKEIHIKIMLHKNMEDSRFQGMQSVISLLFIKTICLICHYLPLPPSS